ncbi:MAG: phosphatase PAP2 family protein [Hylemonella sp.]|nr:phosphatase PAP2 family protein [Hylemonella sp.]
MDHAADRPRIAPWHWALPFVILALSAPLWLGLYEPAVFRTLNRWFSVLPDIVWTLLSLFGTGWAIYAATAPALWRAPRLILSWLCAAPLAGVLTRVGKNLADNPRPLEVLGLEGINVIGEPLFIAAMPSGHTITAFAGAAAIYFALATRQRLRWLWLFVFAFGVACSRVAVGAHWPADVAVGAAAGLLSGLTGAWLAARIPERHLRPQAWLMRGVALFGLYCLYVLWTDEMGFVINLPWQYALGAFLAACLALFASRSLRKN